jgi:hypothetical protein
MRSAYFLFRGSERLMPPPRKKLTREARYLATLSVLGRSAGALFLKSVEPKTTPDEYAFLRMMWAKMHGPTDLAKDAAILALNLAIKHDSGLHKSVAQNVLKGFHKP